MSFFTSLSSYLGTLGKFWQDSLNGQILRWNFLLLVFQFLYLLSKFSRLPPQIPLFYSQPWGEAQLANAGQLFWLPVISLLIVLFNNFFAAFFLRNNFLLSRLLVIFSLVSSALYTVALYQIIHLVS